MREITVTPLLGWGRITALCWSPLSTFYISMNGFQKLWAKGVSKCLGHVLFLSLFTAGLYIPCFCLILFALFPYILHWLLVWQNNFSCTFLPCSVLICWFLQPQRCQSALQSAAFLLYWVFTRVFYCLSLPFIVALRSVLAVMPPPGLCHQELESIPSTRLCLLLLTSLAAKCSVPCRTAVCLGSFETCQVFCVVLMESWRKFQCFIQMTV